MYRVQVFDPAMCCASGVCGPEVDPVLPRFAADLDWLASQGVEVTRYNLAQDPAAFAGNELVKAALEANGVDCLPMVLVDGRVMSTGAYPSRDQLAKRTIAKPHIRITSEGPVCVPKPDGSPCC